MQILLDRSKAFIIPYEQQSVIVVEDIPMRKAHRKPDDPAPSQIRKDWVPVCLDPKDWDPVTYTVDSEYDAAEDHWLQPHKESTQEEDDQRELDIFDD